MNATPATSTPAAASTSRAPRSLLLTVLALTVALFTAFLQPAGAQAATAHGHHHSRHHHSRHHHTGRHHGHHHPSAKPKAKAKATKVPAGSTTTSRRTSQAGPARTATEVSIAQAVLTMLNSERAANHLQPVTTSNQLITSAHNHNLAMARANTMSHQIAGEPSLGPRETSAGYKWSWAGENIGWNSDMSAAGVLLLEKIMYNEVAPNNGHRLNILNSHFTNIGVDVYMDNTNHKVWLTTDFGRP